MYKNTRIQVYLDRTCYSDGSDTRHTRVALLLDLRTTSYCCRWNRLGDHALWVSIGRPPCIQEWGWGMIKIIYHHPTTTCYGHSPPEWRVPLNRRVVFNGKVSICWPSCKVRRISPDPRDAQTVFDRIKRSGWISSVCVSCSATPPDSHTPGPVVFERDHEEEIQFIARRTSRWIVKKLEDPSSWRFVRVRPKTYLSSKPRFPANKQPRHNTFLSAMSASPLTLNYISVVQTRPRRGSRYIY